MFDKLKKLKEIKELKEKLVKEKIEIEEIVLTKNCQKKNKKKF